MTQAQKTTVKTPAKSAVKSAPKAKSEVKALPFFVVLYTAILAGRFGEKAKVYYASADKYHAKQKTVFPREKTKSDRDNMTREKAQSIIEMASKGVLAPGNKEGQAVYDLMKIGADCIK